MRGFAYCLTAAWAAGLLGASAAMADGGDHDAHHDASLHFSHPMVTESPSPDTKLRVGYRRREVAGPAGDTDFDVLRAEGEYAFNPSWSVLAEVPFTRRSPPVGSSESSLDSTEVAIKYASFRFAEQGWLVGGGLALGLPTGDSDKGIGSDEETEIEPFVHAGYKGGRWETVGRVELGFPTNQPASEEDEVDSEVGFQLSALYHLSDRVKPLIELDGESIISGEEDETVVNLSPGIKYLPTGDPDFALGASVGYPLSDDEEFDTRFIVSAFFHF